MIVVVPAGAWHHVTMDDGAAAEGSAFFTVPGTIIEAFSRQMELVTQGEVPYAEVPIVHPKRVDASTWTGSPGSGGGASAQLIDALPAGITSAVRILPFEAPPEGELPLPLDNRS
jgi:hypothetical protein